MPGFIFLLQPRTAHVVEESPGPNIYSIEMFTMCGVFRWDTGEVERMSPWDLQPVTERGK